MHLSEADLVDLAEGSRPESSVPHLTSCEQCRRLLLEMRSMMAAAADVRVPEPSPLFWDHLSNRVRQAVAADRDAPRRWWHEAASWKRALIPVSAVVVAVLLIASALTPRLLAPSSQLASGVPSQAAPASGELDDSFDDAIAEDASLMLVADLSVDVGFDAETDATLAPKVGAEHAVTHLNDDELRELQRLLQQELAPTGA